jgi:serine protease Do
VGTDANTGLLVMHVEPGGPADQAGVLLGDILINIDGHSFEDLDDVHEELRRKGAGQEVQAKIIRGGQNIQMTIRIGERPAG